MKTWALIIAITFTCVMTGCGKGSNSPLSTTNPPGAPGTTAPKISTSVTLLASLTEPGDVSDPGVLTFTTSVQVTIPSFGITTANLSDSGYAVLTIGNTTCVYRNTTDKARYDFKDCTGGKVPGDTINLSNQVVRFELASGYCLQDTRVEISFLVTK